MTDEQLIQRLCDTIDTLSRGGAEQVIRIVREHDRQSRLRDALVGRRPTPEQRQRARDAANLIARAYANE